MSGTLYYIINSYGASEQVYRLIARLGQESPGASFIVQFDSRGACYDEQRLHDLGARAVPIVTPVVWGDFSLTREFIGLLRRLDLQEDDWVIRLTEADYPTPSLKNFQKELWSGQFDMVLERSILRNPSAANLLARYTAQSYVLPTALTSRNIFMRVLARILRRSVRYVPRISLREQPRGLPPRLEVRRKPPFAGHLDITMGSEWCALSGKAVHALVAHHQAHPEVAGWFARTFVGGEAYMPTVLLSEAALVNQDRPLHFLDFEGAHPVWLETADLPRILASDCPFARKFTENSDVLDALDALIVLHPLSTAATKRAPNTSQE